MRKKTRGRNLVPLDVVSALDALGIQYTIRGNEASALCPAHLDRSPSWSINLDTGDHNCFSCGFGGSFSRLVSTLHKSWDTAHVDEWITTRKVRDVVEGRRSLRSREQEKPEPISAADMWKFVAPPRAVLRSRNITSFSAEDYGVLWNPERKTFIIPVRDPQQQFEIIGWQEKGNGIFRNYPRGLEKGKTLFGLELVESEGPMVLVESPLDCLRMLDAGVPNAVASYGASVTDHQMDLISANTSVLIVAMDNDKAGRASTLKVCNALAGRCTVNVFAYGAVSTTGVRRVHVPLDGRDPGDLSDDELRYGVEYATPAWRTGFVD